MGSTSLVDRLSIRQIRFYKNSKMRLLLLDVNESLP